MGTNPLHLIFDGQFGAFVSLFMLKSSKVAESEPQKLFFCFFSVLLYVIGTTKTEGGAELTAKEQAMIKSIETMTVRFLRIGLAILAPALLLIAVSAHAEANFTRIPTQYIAALGDPKAKSGTDAETWGLWVIDPGPRGVDIEDYADLVANADVAPDGWRFDRAAWWLEEHGLIMEAPSFPLPAGQYVVTGGREAMSVLTVEEPDATGKQPWSLAYGANIYDVTHLGCRAALYTANETGKACTPDKAPMSVFPMTPGTVMPEVEGCSKQDYQVLIVIGMMVETNS